MKLVNLLFGFILAVAVCAQAAESDVYYVDPIENPNIVSVVASAAPSSTVYVAKGNYKISSSLIPANGVRIIGETGKYDDVVIDAQNKCRVLLATAGKNYISGLTLTGGYLHATKSANATQGGGIKLTGGGVITNCRITACSSGNFISGIGMYLNSSYCYDVLIDNCTHAATPNSTATSQESTGYIVSLYGASVMDRTCVVRNIIKHGKHKQDDSWGGVLSIANNGPTYASSCIVRNCEIAHNIFENYLRTGKGTTFGSIGVSIGAGILENCTVVSNIVLNAENAVSGTSNDEGACGVAVYPTNNGTIRNCHIADNFYNGNLRNYSTIINNASNRSYHNRFVYCCTYPDNNYFPASTVIAQDSKYGFNERGQIKLEKDSPCIGAGEMQSWMANAKDVYGRTRVRSTAVDIGAVEYIPGTLFFMVR